jgi:hypothetical protein
VIVVATLSPAHDHAVHDDLLGWLGDDFGPEPFGMDEAFDMLTRWREG